MVQDEKRALRGSTRGGSRVRLAGGPGRRLRRKEGSCFQRNVRSMSGSLLRGSRWEELRPRRLLLQDEQNSRKCGWDKFELAQRDGLGRGPEPQTAIRGG